MCLHMPQVSLIASYGPTCEVPLLYYMHILQDMDLHQELNQSVTDGRTRVTLYMLCPRMWTGKKM